MFKVFESVKGAKKEAVMNELNKNNDGSFGRAFEIAIKASGNNKVSGHNEVDKKMYMLKNGKKTLVSVESKTNGGRINFTYSEFIVYAMDICNSTTKGNRRICEPVIMRSETFMNILKECNAIKKVNKNGLLDGYAIQVSNKAFYETIRDYPTKYYNGVMYNYDDIK